MLFQQHFCNCVLGFYVEITWRIFSFGGNLSSAISSICRDANYCESLLTCLGYRTRKAVNLDSFGVLYLERSFDALYWRGINSTSIFSAYRSLYWVYRRNLRRGSQWPFGLKVKQWSTIDDWVWFVISQKPTEYVNVYKVLILASYLFNSANTYLFKVN